MPITSSELVCIYGTETEMKLPAAAQCARHTQDTRELRPKSVDRLRGLYQCAIIFVIAREFHRLLTNQFSQCCWGKHKTRSCGDCAVAALVMNFTVFWSWFSKLFATSRLPARRAVFLGFLMALAINFKFLVIVGWVLFHFRQAWTRSTVHRYSPSAEQFCKT